jgi:hypothetical protein
MIKIYTAADPLQAHILRGALEAAGIAAEVRGDYLFTTRGESPVTPDTAPSVWILDDENFEEARAIVRELETARPASAEPTWPCRCGEAVEAAFDRCWSCGTPRHAGSGQPLSDPDKE